ncbi:MAG TPA: HAD family hydrolase [Verrucomicrobiae bacterium]|jgi:hydroxymethylpyrimidine pyrophosphatase-like HAD family hydrolase|nr:HAD family hydrolase [Verrucomicrobiae bacterium]
MREEPEQQQPGQDYAALAFDYDGTLAWDGAVSSATIDALRRLRESGRKLLMVTGRTLEDLLRIFPRLELFEKIVAENGAVLYTSATGQRRALAAPPPTGFIELMHARGVSPLEAGEVIVATREPNQSRVLEVIRELGLELQLIFNKGAVMVLPPNVNKATGLKHALKELELLPEQVVGVGDAENDHAFLDYCGYSVAVANALPALKEHAAFVTSGPNGMGIIELAERVLDKNLPPARRAATWNRAA